MSSILIKGMDMPGFCIDCPCGHVDNSGVGRFNGRLICKGQYLCPNYDKQTLQNDVKDCPLTEIPTPHGDLIDADRLIAVLKGTTAIAQSDYDLFNHIVALIEHQPTIIEASA